MKHRSLLCVLIHALSLGFVATLPAQRFATEGFDAACATLRVDATNPAARVLYAGFRGASSSIVKFLIPSHDRVASLYFDSSDGAISDVVVDVTERALVVAMLSGRIIRVDTTSFTRTRTLQLGRPDGAAVPSIHPYTGMYMAVASSPLGGQAFAAAEDRVWGTRIARLDTRSGALDIANTLNLTADAAVAALAFLPAASGLMGGAPGSLEGTLYAATVVYSSAASGGSNAAVVRIAVSRNGTMAVQQRVLLAANEQPAVAMVLDARGGALFLCLRNFEPAYVLRLRLSDLQRTHTDELPPIYHVPYAAALEPLSRRLYVATLSPPIDLITYDADSLMRLDERTQATITSTLELASALTIDPIGGLMYMGLATSPAAIYALTIAASTGDGPTLRSRISVGATDSTSTYLRGGGAMIATTLSQVPLLPGDGFTVMLHDPASGSLWSARGRHGFWELDAGSLAVRASALSPLLAPAPFDSGTYELRFDAPFVPGTVLDAAAGFIYAATCTDPLHLHRYRIPGPVLDRVVAMPTAPAPLISRTPSLSCAMQPASGSFLLHAPRAAALMFFYYSSDDGAAMVVQVSTATLEPVYAGMDKFPQPCALHKAGNTYCSSTVAGLVPGLAVWAGAMASDTTALIVLAAPDNSTAAAASAGLLIVQLSVSSSATPVVTRISTLQRPDPTLFVPTMLIRGDSSAVTPISPVRTVWLLFVPSNASSTAAAASFLGSTASSAAVAVVIDTPTLQLTGRNATLPDVGISGVVAAVPSPSRGGILAVGSRGLYLLPDAAPAAGSGSGSAAVPEQALWQDLGDAGSRLLGNESIITAAAWDESLGKVFLSVATGSAESAVTLSAVQLSPGALVAAAAPSSADPSRPARRSLALPATAGPVFHTWVDSGDFWIIGGLRRLMLQRLRASDFTLSHSIALSGLSQRIGTAVADTRRGLLYVFDTDFGNATLFRYAGFQPGETAMAGKPLTTSRSAGRRCAQASAMLASQPIIVIASCSGWIVVVNVTLVGQLDVLYQSRRFDSQGYPEFRVATVSQDTVFIASLQGSVVAVRPLAAGGTVVSPIKYLSTNTGVALKFIYGAMVSGDGSNVYFATRSAPAYVARFAMSSIVTGSSTSLTSSASIKLPDGIDNIATCFVDTQPGQLFEVVVCGTASQIFPGFVAAIVSVKGAFASMTLASVPVPLRGQVIGSSAWDQSARVAYLSTYVSPHRVYRFTFTAAMNPPPPIVRSLLVSPNRGEGFLRAAAVLPAVPQPPQQADSVSGSGSDSSAAPSDTHFALLGSALSPGALVRIALPSRRRLDTLVLQDGEDFVSAVAVTSAVVQSESSSSSAAGGSASGSASVYSSYSAYVGTDNVGLGGLAPVSTTGSSSNSAASVESDYIVHVRVPSVLPSSSGTSAWLSSTTTGSMQRVSALALPAGFASVQFLLLDETRGHLWVGAGLSPGGLVRLDVNVSGASTGTGTGAGTLAASASMAISGTTAFPASVTSVATGVGAAFTSGSGVLDTARSCIYIATVHSPPRLVRVSLPSGLVTNITTLASPLLNARSLLMHPASRMLLVGSGALGVAAGGRIGVIDASVDWRSASWLQQRGQLTLQAASAVEPDAIAALVADPFAPFVYAALDTEPPVIVQLRAGTWTQTAQFSFPTFTERPAALVLAPALLGSQPGASAMLVLTTAAVPSFAFVLQATAASPLIRNATGVLGGLLPSLALCSRFGLPVRSACMFMQSALAGDSGTASAGSSAAATRGMALDVVSFGHFLPANVTARANVSVVLTEAHALQVGADAFTWNQLQLRGPAAASASLLGSACANLACTDGDTCSCSLPASEVTAAVQALSGNTSSSGSSSNAGSAPLLALRYSLVLTVDDVPSPEFPIVLLSGAPRVLRARPSVIAAHGASITIDMALHNGFDAARDAILLRSFDLATPAGTGAATGGSASTATTLACIVASVSVDQQSVTCRPPPLHRSLLGRSFDVLLLQGTSEVASLPSAVQYAWPVLASVFPPVGLPPEGGFSPALNGSLVTITLDAPALLPNVQGGRCFAPAPSVRVWIGTSECANASFADPCTASLRCIPPPGVGLKVPIAVDVAWMPPPAAQAVPAIGSSVGSSGAAASAATDGSVPGVWFNFTVAGVESLRPGLPVSVFDDRYTETPGRPRLGFVTDASYEVPQAAAVVPAMLQLYSPAAAGAAASGSNTDITVAIAGSRFPPQQSVSIRQSGVAAADALVCSPVVSATHDNLLCTWPAQSVASAALAAARAAVASVGAQGSSSVDAGGVLAGSAAVALNITFQEPRWGVLPITTSRVLRVVGRPLLRTASRRISSPDLAELTGAGFIAHEISNPGTSGTQAAAGLAAVNVTFGRAPCGNVTVVSDTLITCTPPSFDAAADGSGNADVRVVVSTAAGSSDLPQLLPVSFVYFSGGMGVRWAASTVQGAATAETDSLAGAVLSLQTTAPLSPLPVAIVTASRDVSCRLLQTVPERLTLAEVDVPATSSGSAGANISFPAVLLSSRALAPFHAELQVRCAESSNVVTSEPLRWPVAAPVLQWADSTLSLLRSRAAFLPDPGDTPGFAINISIGVGDAATRLLRTPSAAPAFAAVMSRLLCSARIALATDAAAAAGNVRGLAGAVDGSVSGPPLQAASTGWFQVRFPGLSLAAFPIGSQLTAAAECVWADATSSNSGASSNTSGPAASAGSVSASAPSAQLPLLTLRIVDASVQWMQPAPAVMESQVYAFPPPIVALRISAASAAAGPSPNSLTASAAQTVVPLTRLDGSNWTFACEMDAALKASTMPASSSDAGGAPNASAADSSGGSDPESGAGAGSVSMIVIKQTVQAPLDTHAVFRAFAVSGRRRAQFTVTARCSLGSQPLPPLSAPSEIAGCPRGQAPSNVTGWTCVECPTGSWTEGGDTPCQPCPSAGAECTGSGLLRLLPGYWRPAKDAAAAITAASSFYPCLNPDACLLNESASSPTQMYGCNAAAGHTGTLCGECLEGFARAGIKCARCAPPGTNALALAGIIAAICAAALWFGRIAQPQQREPLSLAVRTLVGFMQSLSVVTAFKSNAAALVREVLGWTDTANDAVMTVGPISCLLRPSFLARLLMTVSLPLLLTLLVAVLASVIRHRELKQKRRRTLMRAGAPGTPAADSAHAGSERNTASSGTGSGIELASLPASSASAASTHELAVSTAAAVKTEGSVPVPPQQRRPVARLRDRMVFALTAVASLTYMPVITACVKALDCVGPVEGTRLLFDDLSVRCGGTEQRAAAAVAWTVLFVFGLGFPVAIVALLYRYATAPLCGLSVRCRGANCAAHGGNARSSGGAASGGQQQMKPPSGHLWLKVTRRKDMDGRPSMHASRSAAASGSGSGSGRKAVKGLASPSLSPAVTVIIPGAGPSGGKGRPFAAASNTSSQLASSTSSSTMAVDTDTDAANESPVPVILRPLADGYSQRVVYWEAVLLLRKGLLALVGALVPDPLRGLALFALIVAASHLLNAYARPYEDVWFNAAESLSLSATLAIALLSLMYAPGEPATSATNTGVTAAIGIVMAATLAFLVWLVLRSASDARAVNMVRSVAARALRKLGCASCTRFANTVVEPRKSRVSASAVAAAARYDAANADRSTRTHHDDEGASSSGSAFSSASPAVSAVINPLNAAAAAAASAGARSSPPPAVATASSADGASSMSAGGVPADVAASAAATAASSTSAAAPAAAFIKRLVARYSMSGARAAAAFGPTQVLGSNGRGLQEEDSDATAASAWTANPLGAAQAAASVSCPPTARDIHASTVRPPPAFALPPIAVRAPPPRPRVDAAVSAAAVTSRT